MDASAVIEPQSGMKRKRAKKQAERILFICLLLAVFAHLTNPFMRLSVVRDPYSVAFGPQNQLFLVREAPLFVTQHLAYRSIAELKSGWHIFVNRFGGGPKTKSARVETVISEIHKKRFNPEYPYLISGDHFSVLYPRSLGIFYNTLLDPRTALDETDWFNRQALYLKTTGYALSVYEKTPTLSTTIVPIGPNGVTTLNIFAPPSDTLYSLLYALTTLRESTLITHLYPFENNTPYQLQTKQAANALLSTYKKILQKHLAAYTDSVYDPNTGFIRSDMVLSGTKDSAIRYEAFYDNVVYWATQKLAMELGIRDTDELFLSALKERIIAKYWDKEHGFFREDFSPWNSPDSQNYSSDWLITFMTGFLSPNNENDVPYITNSLEYIAQKGINRPFALRYQTEDQKERLHTIVQIFAPSYGTTAIWSHWGMEYSKLLLSLYRQTCSDQYLTEADYTIRQYRSNIETYRGFPEVYTDSGSLFTQTIYTSVRGTGWVVNYEQAKHMLDWTKSEVTKQCSTSAGNLFPTG